MSDVVSSIARALRDDDALLVRRLLDLHPELKIRIDEPVGPFDSPAIVHARSKAMLDALLDAGADVNAKSGWWAGGFGLLDSADPELAAYAIERGAVLDVHAAARLGWIDALRAIVSKNPAAVNARGGDGQTPLHFAATVEIAEYLLERGAHIDARDIDHESTPAQYAVRDRQDVGRHLIRRGCTTDLLMAAAVGDTDVVCRHLDADPDCVRIRVSDEYFPKIDRRAGGTIYQWTLGWHVSAHQVARAFGHEEIVRLLIERSPADVRLLAACWMGEEATVAELLAGHPALSTTLRDGDRRQIAHAARNDDLNAVRLMLAAGLPVDARGQHGATPLHWAAFHGDATMVRLILHHRPPLDQRDTDYRGTPLGWAIHGCENAWHCERGDYATVVEALLEAGTTHPETVAGTDAVREVLRRHGVPG
jgi:ankyrin repeat protein